VKRIDDAAQLRAEFDGSFALPSATRADDHERLLALRLDGDAYALRLSEIAGLVSGRKIVPVPSPVPAVLGVASQRGDVFAVYSLAVLLGHSRPTAPPRWLALCRDQEPVALAFADLDGYFEAPRAELRRPAGDAGARAHLHAVVQYAQRTLSVLDVASLVEAMKRRAAPPGAPQER
jgi:purine-binding chemotaxis protein CheW